MTPETLNTTQLAKLPKWAQEQMSRLQRERDHAQSELRRLLDNSTESKVYVYSRAINMGDKAYIQNDSVNFVLPNGEIQVFLQDDGLQLMARGPCSQIIILPSVTNVIRVTTGD